MREIDGASYVPASDPFSVDDNGVAEIGKIKTLGSGEKYYLVETKAPEGYIAAEPMQVTIDIEDAYASVPENTSSQDKPLADPYNWAQTASLKVGGVARKSDEQWAVITEISAADSNTVKVYYQIPNNPGIVLPATGGTGTQLIYLLGSFLLILAGGLLLFQRKKERKL